MNEYNVCKRTIMYWISDINYTLRRRKNHEIVVRNGLVSLVVFE